jgi:hypothetical protein
MKSSKILFLLGVLLTLSSGGVSAYADDVCGQYKNDWCNCQVFTPDMFKGSSLSGITPYEVVNINQVFNLVNSYNTYVLSASAIQQVATACSTEVDKLNSANDGFNYTCGKVLTGPITRGCYQDLGTVESWGCATAQGASAQISRSAVLNETETHKAQCEKVFEANIFIDQQKQDCDEYGPIFSPHRWSNPQRKILGLISQHLGCK